MSVALAAAGSVIDVSGPSSALIAQPDAMRNGLRAYDAPAYSAAGPSSSASEPSLPAAHAAELVHRNALRNDRRTREALASRAFGSHFTHVLRHEQQALAQHRRVGLPSSMLGLEIALGTHDKIDWCDVLNAPENNIKAQEDPHTALEKRHDAMGW